MLPVNHYQNLANRTCNHALTIEQMQNHALFEMCSEVGEIQSFFQKRYQGHMIDEEKLKLEVGDLLWGIAEFCTANGWEMEQICKMNIDKLRKRYPDGFSEERSLHREEV